MQSPRKTDDLDHAIAKIIQADEKVIQELKDGIVKQEIIQLRENQQ